MDGAVFLGMSILSFVRCGSQQPLVDIATMGKFTIFVYVKTDFIV